MVAAISDIIFTEGVYTIDQAARLARLSPRVMKAWMDGEGRQEPAVIRRLPKNTAGVVGFIDLIQALAIRAIRMNRRLSLQKIRETINAAKLLGIDYPFARKHQTYLFSDDVVVRLPDDQLIQVTGRYRQQHLLNPIVELYLDDLSFDDDGLALQYTPLREDGRSIVIDPKMKYGAPVLMPSGFTVGTLVGAVESEGSIEGAADAFGLENADIKFALRYDDLLAGMAA
jgi:uncharacterized protein (DUF433 family)